METTNPSAVDPGARRAQEGARELATAPEAGVSGLAERHGADWAALQESRVLSSLVRAVLAALSVMALVLWIPGVSRRPGLSTGILAFSAAPLVASLLLARRRRRVAAGRTAIASFILCAVVSVACFGGLRGPVVYALPLSIVAAGLLRGRVAAGVGAAALGAFVVVEAALERAGVAPFVVGTMAPAAGVATVVSAIVAAGGLIVVYAREAEGARREIAESAATAVALEHELADMVRYAPDGMAVLDREGVVERANDAMGALVGRPARELAGLGLATLLAVASDEEREALQEGIARLHERGEALWELALPRASGAAVRVEAHARFLAPSDGSRKVQLIVRDVTARAEAEAARTRLEAELRESRRLQGLGRLAGGIAHDFRNLLSPILANVDALRDGGRLGGSDHELATEIELAARRANDLTQQLLAFARRQRMEIRAVDLNAVIRDLEPILRRLARGNVRFELALALDLGPLKGDRSQLEQVLVNLVVNARDAMPDGGILRVVTSSVVVSPAEAAQRAGARAGRWVALQVSDTGVGIPEEVRRHLFEPFFTTKGEERGTGLGLATVQGIVAQCGGSIDVESAVGGGTTFRILLPGAEVAHASPAAGEVPVGTDLG